MKTIIDMRGSWKWAREHPLTAILFAVVFLNIGFFSNFKDAESSIVTIAMWIVASASMALIVLCDVKKWVSIIVALAMMVPLPARTARPAPIVVGCLVVAVGIGIVGCRLNALCKKKFGTPSTNAPQSEFYFSGDGDTEAAVVCVHHKKSCDDVGLVAGGARFISGEQQSASVSIAGRLVMTPDGPEIESFTIAITPEVELFDFAGYEQRMIALGLTPCISSGCASFSRNGIPIDRGDSRISFSTENGVPVAAVSSDQPSFTVAIERSSDLKTWEQITLLKVPAGNLIAFGDSPDAPSAFYRMMVMP